MKKVFDKLEEGILIINSKGTIVFCNQQLRSKLGYTGEEIEEKYFEQIVKRDKNQPLYLEKYIGKTMDLVLLPQGGGHLSLTGEISCQEWIGEKVYFILFSNCECPKLLKEGVEILLDQIPFVIWIKDRDGEYKYINQMGVETITKYIQPLSREEIIGKLDREIWKSTPEEQSLGLDKAVIESKQSRSCEYGIKVGEQTLNIEMYKAPLLDENNEVRYIVGMSQDVSLSRKMEKELAKSNGEFSILNSLINYTRNKQERYETLRSINSEFIRAIGADSLVIGIYDALKNKVNYYYNQGVSKKVSQNTTGLKIKPDVFQDLLQREECWGIKPIEFFESQNPDGTIDRIKKEGIKYIGCYPIAYDEMLLGYIAFGYKDKKSLQFSQESFIQRVCDQIAILITNDNLHYDVKQELIKRKETENELERFLNIATDMLAMIGHDGCFKKVSCGWTKILGWSEQELLDRRWQDIIHPDDAEETSKYIKQSEKWEFLRPSKIVNRCKGKDGEYRWLEWSNSYFEEKEVHFCTARDITKAKELAREKRAYQEALQAESIKNEIFSNMSHEFKTPLNIILTMMQLIDKNIEDHTIEVNGEIDLHKYIGTVKQNAYRLLRLINNVIDITRIDTGYYNLNLCNCNIVNVIEEIAMSVAQYTAERGISLIFDTQEEEIRLACDQDKIERIVLNLLSNAIKHTDAEGTIQVNMALDKDKVVVSIKDNGHGIPKEKLESIFDRFIQVENSLTKKIEGSGIGLALVKSLVEMHEGKVWVKSELGEGSEFIFELPIKLVEEKENNNIASYNPQVEKYVVEFSDIYNIG